MFVALCRRDQREKETETETETERDGDREYLCECLSVSVLLSSVPLRKLTISSTRASPAYVIYYIQSGIETPDRNGQWYQNVLTVCAIFFMRAIPKGQTFGLMFIRFMFVKCACFVLYSTSLRFDSVKSPEVILCL